MEIQYVYMKQRSQFGKQCIFDTWGPVVDENLNPNPELMSDYIFRDPCHASAQKSTQLALHEMQTCSATVRENGMNHTEGGWPKEINFKDEEATTRFRRRVEKEDIWAPKMKALIEPMEHYVLQNNAVNIYENYFDDMIPTELLLPLGVRTVNVYSDPQINVRPITNLSWSPDHGNRLAVSYCCMEFQKSEDLSPYSYIWEIENPNQAFMALKSFCPSVDIEFNPRDPSMLISGLKSGQVCYWDIRTGNVPVQISQLQFSHREPASHVLWINSKNNAEFFSASTGGLMKWWDIRRIREPTETLVMDLNNPQVGDVVKAIGISSMNFEPTMGTKFMAGLENGQVISGSRKGKNPAEKLALRFNCHYGPVVGLERNPFSPKNFLTVGDWTGRVWAEDTKESCLLSTPFYKELLTGGCWSTSRYSVFYLINHGGELQVWDILVGMDKPVTVLRLCEVGLRAIKPQDEGKLIAVGNAAGDVFLIEPSEALTTNAKNDKPLMTSYLERDSRYEKAIDNRLKEVRLMQRADYMAECEPIQPMVKKGRVKDKGKDKGTAKKDKQSAEGKDRKKGKEKKGKEVSALADDPELAEAEIQYYATIQKEVDKYASIEDPDDEEGRDAQRDSGKKKKKDDKKGDKEGSKKGGKKSPRKSEKVGETGYVIVKRKPSTIQEAFEDRVKRMEVAEAKEEEEEEAARRLLEISEKDELEKYKTFEKSVPSTRVRGPKFISGTAVKPCGENVVCDRKICCKDVVQSLTSRKDDDETESVDLALSETNLKKMMSRLSIDIAPVIEYSADEKRRILEEKDARPNILEREVRLAKKEIREEMEVLKKPRMSPPRSHFPVVKETKVQEWSGEVDSGEEQEKEATSGLVNEFSDPPDSEPSKRRERKIYRKKVDRCSPRKAAISVLEVVAPTAGTKMNLDLPKAQEVDLKYKMRNAIELIYPRISAAGNIKSGPIPELQVRTPTPPDDTPFQDLDKKNKNKNKSTKKD